MSTGDLIAFVTYITQILSSLMMVTMMFVMFSRAMASAKRIREVMEENIDIKDIDLSDEDKALNEYDRFCLELIKEIDQLNEKVILLRASEPMLELEKYYGDRDKYKEVIEEVRERLEYYLIGNMKYEDSQKEFKKLLQMLDKVKDVK